MNTVTASERGEELSYVKSLVGDRLHLTAEEVGLLISQIVSERGISRERARQYLFKVIRQNRNAAWKGGKK